MKYADNIYCGLCHKQQLFHTRPLCFLTGTDLMYCNPLETMKELQGITEQV